MPRQALLWSLAILLLLMLYLVATIIFAVLFQEVSKSQLIRTPTPAPTFTPTPAAEPAGFLPTVEIPTATPTEMPSPTPSPAPLPPTETPSPTPEPKPQVVAGSTVNVRSGPGTNYPVIDALPPNVPLPITGRNAEGTWWQIQGPAGQTGWVAGSVVEARNTAGVAIAQAPPPPPTPTPVEPTPTPRPQYQFEPTGWFADTNYGLTRFLGTITDAGGNPVNGVYVEAQCGSFRVLSNPSGSTTWSAGFYDITLDTRPIPCKWFLSVVTSDDGRTATSYLSEAIEVETTIDESIVTANWRKNW